MKLRDAGTEKSFCSSLSESSSGLRPRLPREESFEATANNTAGPYGERFGSGQVNLPPGYVVYAKSGIYYLPASWQTIQAWATIVAMSLSISVRGTAGATAICHWAVIH
jgi:hypothetical protein